MPSRISPGGRQECSPRRESWENVPLQSEAAEGRKKASSAPPVLIVGNEIGPVSPSPRTGALGYILSPLRGWGGGCYVVGLGPPLHLPHLPVPHVPQQPRHQARPPRLVAGAQPLAVVAVEELVEEDEVAEVLVVVLGLFAVAGPPARRGVGEEQDGEPPLQFLRHFAEVHPVAGARRALDLEGVAVVVVVALEGFDEQEVGGEPDRAAPVGVAAE